MVEEVFWWKQYKKARENEQKKEGQYFIFNLLCFATRIFFNDLRWIICDSINYTYRAVEIATFQYISKVF